MTREKMCDRLDLASRKLQLLSMLCKSDANIQSVKDALAYALDDINGDVLEVLLELDTNEINV